MQVRSITLNKNIVEAIDAIKPPTAQQCDMWFDVLFRLLIEKVMQQRCYAVEGAHKKDVAPRTLEVFLEYFAHSVGDLCLSGLDDGPDALFKNFVEALEAELSEAKGSFDFTQPQGALKFCEDVFQYINKNYLVCKENFLYEDGKSKVDSNYFTLLRYVQEVRFYFLISQKNTALDIALLRHESKDLDTYMEAFKAHHLLIGRYTKLSWEALDNIFRSIISGVGGDIAGKVDQVFQSIKHYKEECVKIAQHATKSHVMSNGVYSLAKVDEHRVSTGQPINEGASERDQIYDHKSKKALNDFAQAYLESLMNNLEPIISERGLLMDLLKADQLERDVANSKFKNTVKDISKSKEASLVSEEGGKHVSTSFFRAHPRTKSILKGIGLGLVAALALIGIGAIIYFSAGAVLPGVALLMVHAVGAIGLGGALGIASGMALVGSVIGGVVGYVNGGKERQPAINVPMQNVVTENNENKILMSSAQMTKKLSDGKVDLVELSKVSTDGVVSSPGAHSSGRGSEVVVDEKAPAAENAPGLHVTSTRPPSPLRPN